MHRVTILVFITALAVTAQTLPFRTQGDFYVADHGSRNEAIFRFQDRNQDGDVQDPGEQIIFFDLSGPGPNLTNMQALTVSPFDGSVWVSGTTADKILRLEDRNGDGDANDAGEYRVFYDGTGGIPISSVMALSFDGQGALYLLNSGLTDNVIRLKDKNGDGDALDPGEATIFFDNSASGGPWLKSPADLVYYRGAFFLVDNTISPKRIVRLQDLNQDGDALDKGEARIWADPAAAGGSFVWNLAFEAGTPALYGIDILTGNVYRWQDLNNDGDALDAGEAKVFFDSANNASKVSLRVSFTIAGDPQGAFYVCNHTADTVYRLKDGNGDGDANDAGEVSVYVSNTGPPPLAKPLDRARDCIFGPAGRIQIGGIRPTIGKTVPWLLDDPLGGGLPYAAAVSLGQTGIPLGPPDIRRIPLSFDGLFLVSLGGLLPIFQNFQGVFPPAGQSIVKIAIPNEPGLVNVRVYMAFVTVKPGAPSGILTVSKPYSFVIGR